MTHHFTRTDYEKDKQKAEEQQKPVDVTDTPHRMQHHHHLPDHQL